MSTKNMPQLIDTHCHLNFKNFEEDGGKIITDTLAEDIWMINVGSQINTSRRAVALAEKYSEGVYALIGLHPVHLIEYTFSEQEEDEEIGFKTRAEIFNYDEYKKLALSSKVVGIGECGLEYFRLEEMATQSNQTVEALKKLQRENFIAQLNLARELNLPLCVHCRPSTLESDDAYIDVYEILKQENFSNAVLHCYNGSAELAQKFVALGCYLSFTGNITFKKNMAKYQPMISALPIDRIMVETDAPYLTPEPHRGKTNIPQYVRHVANKIAEFVNLSQEEIYRITTENARRFWGI